jgi:hypothetical protein
MAYPTDYNTAITYF